MERASVNCIKCGYELRVLSMGSPNVAGGVYSRYYAGHGSEHEGDKGYMFVCDDCIYGTEYKYSN